MAISQYPASVVASTSHVAVTSNGGMTLRGVATTANNTLASLGAVSADELLIGLSVALPTTLNSSSATFNGTGQIVDGGGNLLANVQCGVYGSGTSASTAMAWNSDLTVPVYLPAGLQLYGRVNFNTGGASGWIVYCRSVPVANLRTSF